MILRAYTLLRKPFFGVTGVQIRLFLATLPLLLLAVGAAATSDCEEALHGAPLELSRLVKVALQSGILSADRLRTELESDTPRFELKGKPLTSTSLPVVQGLKRAAAKVNSAQWAMSRGLFGQLLTDLHDQSQKSAEARIETAPLLHPKRVLSFETNERYVNGLRLTVTPDERIWVSYMGESIHLHPADEPAADQPQKLGSSDVFAPLDSLLTVEPDGRPLLHVMATRDHKPAWWRFTEVLLSRWTMAFGEKPKQLAEIISPMRKNSWGNPKMFKRGERFFFSYFSFTKQNGREHMVFELPAPGQPVKNYSLLNQSETGFVPTADGIYRHAMRPLAFEFNGKLFSGYAHKKEVVLESEGRTQIFEMPYEVHHEFTVNLDNGEPVIAVNLHSNSEWFIGLIKPFASSDQVRVYSSIIGWPQFKQWVRLPNGGRLLSLSVRNSGKTQTVFFDERIGFSQPIEMKGNGKLIFATGQKNVYFLMHDEESTLARVSNPTVDIYSLFNEVERR